jgi:PEGA domain
VFVGVIGELDVGSGRDSWAADTVTARAKGTWTECPAFEIGTQYTLTVRNTSDARLEDISASTSAPGKPIKLEYLSSAGLPPTETQVSALPQSQTVTSQERATVHITSSPSGGEIYVDGKFVGNTPSDITIAAGEHIVKVTNGGKEWSRSILITSGEISLHAEIPADK